MNAQSVVGKVNELNAVATEIEPDIILITETWCHTEIDNAFLSISGYEVQQDLRRDRNDTRDGRGGGLLVYTKQGLKVLARDNNVEFNQYCSFEINDTTLYLIYRPPNGTQENMAQLAKLVQNVEKNAVMIGDFNLPGIDWAARTARPGERCVLEAAEEKMMEQMVDFSTHTKVTHLI
jgi:Endonuclease-reverse transcriptase